MDWFAIIDDDKPLVSIDRWGPNGWKFIIACAFAYPIQPTQADRDNMRVFLSSMQHVLPCHRCRVHYNKQIQTLTAESVSSRESLLRWVCAVRNAINRDTQKPEVSFEDMIRDSLTGCKRNVWKRITKKTLRNYLYAAILLLVLFLIIARMHRDASP